LGKEDLLSVASGWLNRSFGQPDKPHCLSNLVLPIGRFIDLGQLLCASHSLESCSIPGFVNSINELKVPKRPQKKQQNIGKARHKVAILQVPKRKGRKKGKRSYLVGGATTIFKNDGVRQWGWDGIPYMETKIHVPNHLPVINIH
jgi:hypothetical protein